jgi:hypothetical protein
VNILRSKHLSTFGSAIHGTQIHIAKTSDAWYIEVEEGQERSDRYIETERLNKTTSGEKSFGQGTAWILKVRAGTPVFIVTRCIAADNWAAGTVYESINQSTKVFRRRSVQTLKCADTRRVRTLKCLDVEESRHQESPDTKAFRHQ